MHRPPSGQPGRSSQSTARSPPHQTGARSLALNTGRPLITQAVNTVPGTAPPAPAQLSGVISVSVVPSCTKTPAALQ